jgi:hypothetical protein
MSSFRPDVRNAHGGDFFFLQRLLVPPYICSLVVLRYIYLLIKKIVPFSAVFPHWGKRVFCAYSGGLFFCVRKIWITSEANPLVSSDFSNGLKKSEKREFILVSYSTSTETNMDNTASYKRSTVVKILTLSLFRQNPIILPIYLRRLLNHSETMYGGWK